MNKLGVCIKHCSLGCHICRYEEDKMIRKHEASISLIELNKKLIIIQRLITRLEDIINE